MKTRHTELPRHIGNVIDEQKKIVDQLYAEHRERFEQVYKHLLDNFVALGGCERCRGRGWVVVADTMDYMDGSAAEFGPCPVSECTQETRQRSGMHPYNNKYDRIQGSRSPVHDIYNKTYGHLLSAWSEAETHLSTLQYNRSRFLKGDKVVVARGRKVPIGTIGVISYINDISVLIKPEDVWQDRNANGSWVYTTNIEKLV